MTFFYVTQRDVLSIARLYILVLFVSVTLIAETRMVLDGSAIGLPAQGR